MAEIVDWLSDGDRDDHVAIRAAMAHLHVVSAHPFQARHRLEQISAARVRWSKLEALAEERGRPERLVIALELSLFDGAERAACAREADVSVQTASADLRRLVDAGPVVQEGRTRNPHYVAGRLLRERVDPATG